LPDPRRADLFRLLRPSQKPKYLQAVLWDVVGWRRLDSFNMYDIVVRFMKATFHSALELSELFRHSRRATLPPSIRY
jgi:hypothetical protein